MAQLDITTIKKQEKERNMIHDEVYTTYTVFTKDGEKYVQIDTYGRSDREIPGKISQSVQLNKNSARFLVNLLKKEFDF